MTNFSPGEQIEVIGKNFKWSGCALFYYPQLVAENHCCSPSTWLKFSTGHYYCLFRRLYSLMQDQYNKLTAFRA